MPSDPAWIRTDPLSGDVVRIVPSRQSRPNQPESECPFCVGGLEAPEPYVVRSFVNRWPSFPDDRCEVVLYGPEHGVALPALGSERVAAVVDLWASRTAALGARSDVSYVLVFENHGPSVGATIDHPHGQIFAYEHLPPAPARALAALESGVSLFEDLPELIVFEAEGWRAWVPEASVHPHQVRLAPLRRRPSLASLDAAERTSLASVLTRLLVCIGDLFGEPTPYMFWWVQAPTDGGRWERAWLHLELVCPWRSPGVARFIAAGELGGGVYINPVDPLDAADRLRARL